MLSDRAQRRDTPRKTSQSIEPPHERHDTRGPESGDATPGPAKRSHGALPRPRAFASATYGSGDSLIQQPWPALSE
jgi:hypothetical protein